MPNPLPHPLGEPLPRRVAILRALQLGDLLCAVPSFRALRAAVPEAQITLVGLPWARAFVDRFGDVLDDFLALPGYPGLLEQEPDPVGLQAFLGDAQRLRFDLAIQMHGSGTITNPLAVLLGARATAGYYQPGEYCPDSSRFLPYPDQEPEVRRHLRLMEHLGVPSRGEELAFPLGDDDHQALAALAHAGELRPGGYACIHPGARAAGRRWDPRRFAVVADALADRGLQIVLTGAEAEKGLAQAVVAQMRNAAIDLVGQTDLGALAALLAGSRLLVCNDTGVSHLGAALRVPSLVIFTGSDPRRWAPLDPLRHRVIAAGDAPDATFVLDQADELLGTEPWPRPDRPARAPAEALSLGSAARSRAAAVGGEG